MKWLRQGKYILIILMIFLLSFIIIRQTRIKAEVAYFYPQNCLGSFINPEKVQGEPEVKDPNLINEANSAVYLGGFKEIYCGNFKGPEVKGEVKKITLHFNWIVTKERREAPVVQPTSTEPNILEKLIPSKTIEINFNTSSIPTTSPENTTTKPQSFLFKFVFAQKTQTETTTSSAVLESTMTNNSETINQSTETSSETTASTSAQELTTTFSSLLKTLFEIHYTLDGENWNYLGNINEANWQNIFFEIPVNNWLELSKIQIKINSLPDTDYYLYLESMWFEVEYEEKGEENDYVDILGDYRVNIVLPKDNFELSEFPSSEIKVFKKNDEIENEADISEISSIKIKIFNSNKELVFQTNKLEFDPKSKNIFFNLNNFPKLYPDVYKLKIYLNKYLAGEQDFKWGGNVLKKENIDSDKELIFIEFDNKKQIWYLTKSDINSFEKIWEGDEFPNYKILDNYLLLNLKETILGYDLLSKTFFTHTFENLNPTIIKINNKKFLTSQNFEFQEINESLEYED